MTSLEAYRHLLRLLGVRILVGFFLIGTLNAQRRLTIQVAESVESVRRGDDASARTDAAERLFELTRGERSRGLGNDSISEIASLLDWPEDSVRYWVARSLGNFGPRGRLAIPKLKNVLSQVECLRGSKTSASGVRFALKQMGEPTPHSKCD